MTGTSLEDFRHSRRRFLMKTLPGGRSPGRGVDGRVQPAAGTIS